MACRDSVVRMTGPTCGDHIPGARDQAALGTHTAKGRATDELYRDKKFSIATDFSRSSVETENLEIWDFPCRDMGLMSR